jgi:hypothetical protein
MRLGLTHREEVPRGGLLFITIAMPLDPAFGFAMVVFFFWMVDAFKHLILSTPMLSIYKRVLFFVLRYCVVKYANIFTHVVKNCLTQN